MGRITEVLANLRNDPSAMSRTSEPRQLLGTVLATRGGYAETPHVYGGRQIKLEAIDSQTEGLPGIDRKDKRLADEFRAIKRPLLANSSKTRDPVIPRGNLWAVTSAVAGEGKTFTCVNLSLALARERDWSVVLVDGDCEKRHVTRLVGADEEPGLIELLKDSSLTFDSLVMPTNVRGLAILPAGTRDEHAAEFLASARMDQICEFIAAADRRRIIVFDGPPLSTIEASALTAHAGQIVVVVQANKTPQKVVLEALGRLDPSRAVSLLLNQADPRENAYGYAAYP